MSGVDPQIGRPGAEEISEVVASDLLSTLPGVTSGEHAATPRVYLEKSILPVLMQGLNAVVQERPANPVEYLAVFLLKNNPQKS